MTNDANNNGLVQITNRQIAKKEDVCPGAKDKAKLDLKSVREKIDFALADDAQRKTGPQYWRSL
jgi:hypothetical protein